LINRGGLAYTLAKIRQVADKEYEVYQQRKLQEEALHTDSAEEQSNAELLYQRLVHGTPQSTKTSSSPVTSPSPDSTYSSSVAGTKEFIDEADSGSDSGEAVVEEQVATGSQLVMRNFRELLWYWKEYYLRRGRDRLSIEFSSHIPFHFWFELVGKSPYVVIFFQFI
jgi:hypothetical protein